MEKLTIKDLAPYLPYNIKAENCLKEIVEIKGLHYGSDSVSNELWLFKDETYMRGYLYECKPVLKPLSDLTKEDFKEELYQYYQTLGIDVKLVNYDSGNDNPFDITLSVTYKLMGDVFTDALINRGSTSESPYHVIKWLCENHFDINNLIKQGLAIDINTLK